MDPISTIAWQTLATKAPELIILALILAVAYKLGVRWIDRVAETKARQFTAITDFAKGSMDRFLRAQEAQSIAMARISDTLERARTSQQDMDLALRAMADKVNDIGMLVKEIHDRGNG